MANGGVDASFRVKAGLLLLAQSRSGRYSDTPAASRASV
jgi:hypothetical protein